MQIVATIRPGHVIKTDENRFMVEGSMKIRGRYFYIVKDQAGRKVSLGREDVLQAQREGSAQILAA